MEEIGKTSDGSSKRIYPAKLDIDMAKCCFCGLCTTACPTECLKMTKDYDFSEFDVAGHNFEFSEMTPLQIFGKKRNWRSLWLRKEKAKAEADARKVDASDKSGDAAKPGFKPKAASDKPKADSVGTRIRPKAPGQNASQGPQEMARKLMEEKKKTKGKRTTLMLPGSSLCLSYRSYFTLLLRWR